MKGNLLKAKKMSKLVKIICLTLSILVMLKAVKFPAKAGSSSMTASFLKEIIIDETQW